MGRSIANFVDVIGRAVDAASDRHAAFPRRKIGAIVEACGWKSRSTQRMGILQAALEDAGLYPSYDLLDPYLGLDTWIKFGRKPFPRNSSVVVDQEKALSYYLSLAPERLTAALPDLGRLRHVCGGKTPQRRFWLDGKGYVPDLIFETKRREWIVCEVELGPPKHESVPQLRGYVEAVHATTRHSTIGVLFTGHALSDGAAADVVGEIAALAAEGRRLYWVVYDFLRLVPIASFASGPTSNR